MAKKKNANQNQDQGDIIELTDVVEEQSDGSSFEETIEDLEEVEEAGEEPEVSPILGDESGDTNETEASVSDDDLDFDALFEELDNQDEDDTEGFETEAVETTLSPEDEGEVTGGIHTPDSEEDFDALLEDLDKSQDMFSSLSESEEEQPGERETPASSSQDAVSEEPEEEDIEDIPQMDEDEELESEVSEGEDEPEMEPQPLEAEVEEKSELEPQALDEDDDEEAELEPQALDELDVEDDEEAEIEPQSLEDEGDAETGIEAQSLDDETHTEIEPEALQDEADTGIEPEAPQAGEAIDVRDLANRLERLENAQSDQRISEEHLLGALNELPSDAAFWSRIEERVQNVVENKVREYTQDMEDRIAKLQESLDNLNSDNLVTRQTLEQEIREVKEELPSMQDIEEHKHKLRQELQQEMESQIPAAAARVIREEIQNLRSEMGK